MVKVYQQYSAAELQRQYSARMAVPEHPRIFQGWREQSEQFRRQAHAELDIPYGDDYRQQLDLFLPDQPQAPLLVFLHGGYWQAMDKSDFSFLARELGRLGAAVAVVNYGLCPSVTLKQINLQIQQALKWLWNHSGKFDIDAGRLHVSGHSAGAQLAAMMLVAGEFSELPMVPADLIKSVTCLSGLFELEPLIHTQINDALGLNRESARKNSPILFYPKMKAPLRLYVGGLESDEFHRQSIALQRAWGHEGVDISYQSLAGLNHFTLVEQLVNADSAPFKDLCGLIGLSRCQ